MATRQVFVEAGRRGARARWGERRIIDIRDLDPDHRRLVSAFVDMARATAARKEAAGGVEAPTAELEGHGNVRPAA